MPTVVGQGVSGQFGDAKSAGTSITEVRKWTFNPKATNPRYASNKTQGYKRVVAGIAEASGTANLVWDPTAALLSAGTLSPNNGLPNAGAATPTLTLYLSASAFFAVATVIDSQTVNVDIDTGEIVSYDIAFSANGKWDQPGSGLTLLELDLDEEENYFIPDAEYAALSAKQIDTLASRRSRYLDDLAGIVRRTKAVTVDDWQEERMAQSEAFEQFAARRVEQFLREQKTSERRTMRDAGVNTVALVLPG